MKVTVKKLADLHVMEKNIRRHTDKQLKEYVRSITMFGQFKPIVVDENGLILAGNGLYYALQNMGAETCDCYVMTGLTENQKKKLMLADNRVYELGFTDTGIFDEIIRELGGDVDVPGWDADLLEMLNASVREATEMVENYGVYDAGEVEAVNSKERQPDTPAAAPAAAPA
ncbi:MAG: ParB N-terminal domain-containing protein, partial [Synergistaceae bacterium]|nr:ParB N-terminal domain-containing protein [Synergistaceae bacterium]